MNLDNVRNMINERIKNYKTMCELLNEPYHSGGNAKIVQLETWLCYFNYKKVGQSFIIIEIYEQPLIRLTDKGIMPYIENVEKLILNLLTYEKESRLHLSKNQIIKELQIINDNYLDCKYMQPKLATFLRLDEGMVNDYYDLVDSMLERMLETGLKRLSDKALILWRNSYKIIEKSDDEIITEYIDYKDKYGRNRTRMQSTVKNYQLHREATEEDEKYILHCQYVALKEMKLESMAQVGRMNKWKQFNEIVNNFIRVNNDWIGFYQCYEIKTNLEDLEDYNHRLKDAERIKIQKDGNSKILSRINDNIENRHKTPNNVEIRKKKNYNTDMKKINNTLISIKQQQIKENVSNVNREKSQ